MKIQTVVRYLESGKKGVVVSDPFGSCSPDEVPVVFQGHTASMGIPLDELEVIGPENAIADPERCGAGKGDQCCIFLVWGGNDWECCRFGPLRYSIIFRKEKMGAKRHPIDLYPNCQLTA